MKQIYLGGKYGSVIGNYALVDDEDFEELNKHKWYCSKDHLTFYAMRMKRRRGKSSESFAMHRVILGIHGMKILGDHRDRNGLNNQRFNLRKCTHAQNMQNRSSVKCSGSKYLGVTWNKSLRKWKTTIGSTYLGYYLEEAQAAMAYDIEAVKRYGEFANLNFK